MDDLKELTHRLNEYEATILRMNQERAALFEEVQAYRTCFECVAWFGSVGLLALGREYPGTNLPAVYFAVACPIRCGHCHTGLDEVCSRGWREAPLHITE